MGVILVKEGIYAIRIVKGHIFDDRLRLYMISAISDDFVRKRNLWDMNSIGESV